jgi:uncharacterized protein (TIGR03435 family)
MQDCRIISALRLPEDRFHVIATIPPGTTKDLFHRMLQNLLAERFKLAVHRESREMEAFRLVVAGRECTTTSKGELSLSLPGS